MSTSRIQLVSKGRQQPLNGAPNFNSVDHPWAGYPFEEMGCTLEPVPGHFWPKTVLCLCTSGEGTARWRHRGVWHTNRVRPGSAFIVRRDAEVQALQATIGWQNMLLQLDKCSLRQIAPDEVTLIEKSLTPAQSTDDARLAALMLAMRQEVRDGCPSGRLYAESISLALLAYLAGAYANQRQVETRTAALTPTQKRRLVDYIRANLASNISVAEIAGLVQMSPSHFARVFKASFGVAPYQYVLWERIETAKGMLVDTKLSGSHVAMALGFASQSHFAKVFRQFTGVTPKQYQAGL